MNEDTALRFATDLLAYSWLALIFAPLAGLVALVLVWRIAHWAKRTSRQLAELNKRLASAARRGAL